MVLHTARIRTSQKAGLGVFLCLSLVMVVFSITRVSKISGASGVDVPWLFFWQFMEASVAVLMGSLTVFRTLLIADGKSKAAGSPGEKGGCGGGGGEKRSPRSYYSFYHRMRLLGRRKEHGDLESQDGSGLPEIPSATMTGLRTFIRRNHRDPGLETGAMLTAISQHSTLADEEGLVPKVKDKEDKVKEEVRQVTPLMVPQTQRDPPIAYHYPVSTTWIVSCREMLANMVSASRYGDRSRLPTRD